MIGPKGRKESLPIPITNITRKLKTEKEKEAAFVEQHHKQ